MATDESGVAWLDAMQAASGAYVERSWPGETVLHATIALAEEAGELHELLLPVVVSRLSRAVLKREHGTRGTSEQWSDQIRKEAADVLLVLLDIARREHFSLAASFTERVAEVGSRSLNHDDPVDAAGRT